MELSTRNLLIAIGAIIFITIAIYFIVVGMAKKKAGDPNDPAKDKDKGKDNKTVEEQLAGLIHSASVEDAFDPTYWQALNKSGAIYMTTADVDLSKDEAKRIYDAVKLSPTSVAASVLSLGISNLIGVNDSLDNTNFDEIKSVIQGSGSKAFVSMISQTFQHEYGKKLYDYLKSHLDDKQLTEIRNIVADLVDYQKI